MSKSEHAYFGFQMASYLCALAGLSVALFKGSPAVITTLGGFTMGLHLLAGYFHKRAKRQNAEHGEVGTDQPVD